jgi:hypothetical protein
MGLLPRRDPPDDGCAVEVRFRSDGADATGLACFFPASARWREGRVAQPGDAAMAFTWCRQDEVERLTRAWREALVPKVAPHRQGDVRN